MLGEILIYVGVVLMLNGIGSVIWDLTAEPISVQGIVHKLMAEYEVTADQCELEVKDFLHELHHANLVMIHV